MKTQKITTIDPQEVERFSRIASQWWDPEGKFKPLHAINPLRVQWILEQVKGRLSGNQGVGESGKVPRSPDPPIPRSPVGGLSLLDIGCGGGLISEPMCRLGAHVTGIDASEKNIAVASLHAQAQGLSIDYRCMSAEELVAGETWNVVRENNSTPPLPTLHPPRTFDIVLALEIIEHVADIPAFVEACCQLVKPGGTMILSTINRTAKAYALAILGAEYVLRWLPRGTHTWKKFVKPSELHTYLRRNGMEVTAMTGMTMNPLNFQWKLNKNDLDVNYLLAARKQS